MPLYKPDEIPDTWRSLLLEIPGGYDSIATAGNCCFDSDTAELWVSFFHECIRHVKGSLAGELMKLERWQQAIICNAYGWKKPNGLRRYSECFVFVARKNGKTCLIGGIVLGTLVLDNEKGAECYSAAADRDQASLVFQQAQGMVGYEPELESRMQIYSTTKSITYPETNSFFRSISAEAHSKHGYNPHLIIVDELHAQPNSELVDVLNTGKGARSQPITWYITTSDYERPGSICNEMHDYASKVRDGIIDDPTFLPAIYEATLEDDWTDPAVWAKANPNLGVSVSYDFLAKECKRAQENPRFENTFKRLYLNIRTEQAVRWIAMDAWDACAVPISIDDGRPCFGGLDLATTTDLASLALVWPDGDVFDLKVWYWVPEENARDRARNDRVPYLDWIREGWITATPGNVIDYDVIIFGKMRHLICRFRHAKANLLFGFPAMIYKGLL